MSSPVAATGESSAPSDSSGSSAGGRGSTAAPGSRGAGRASGGGEAALLRRPLARLDAEKADLESRLAALEADEPARPPAIVFMQCGPVRFRTSAKREARRRPFAHRAILRPTGFRMPERRDGEGPTIHEIHAALAADDRRNELIVGEVAQALEAGRSPILLTEQKDHARLLADRLDRFTPHVLLLLGGMGTKRHRGSGDGSRTSPRPGSGY